MKIGLQMYTLRKVMETEEQMAVTLARVKEIGYECVQLAGTLEQMERVGLAAMKAGLPAVSLMATLEEYMRNETGTFRVAKLLGATDLGISSAHKTLEETQELIQQANSFAQRAKAQGLSFSYHNHSNELIRMAGEKTGLDLLLDGFSSEVCFTPDTYWLQHGGADVRLWLTKLSSRTKILHLKDMKRTAEGVTFAEIGEGNLWWDGILPLAVSAGIEIFVVEQDKCDGDPLESIEISYRCLRRKLSAFL